MQNKSDVAAELVRLVQEKQLLELQLRQNRSTETLSKKMAVERQIIELGGTVS